MANREKSPILVPRPNNRSPLRIVPQSLLHDCLVRGEGAPLEPSLRSFMESRFRSGFGDVRIHTGATAGALCEAMQARALTLGRDIVFGAGQYAPGSPHGGRLLAHELVHVLQQRGTVRTVPLSHVTVGSAHDTSELEADRIAGQVMRAPLRVVVTPDATTTIRRAIRVDPDSVLMTADKEGSDPSSTISTVSADAYLHLTRNANTAMYGLDTQDEREAGAINIKAQVDVEVGSRDDLSKWTFRFIQLSKLLVTQWVYAGSRPHEGSMMINYATPPVFEAKFAYEFTLDSQETDFNGNKVMPFMNVRPLMIVPKGPGRMTVSTDLDDHPLSKGPYKRWNRMTVADNYLFRAIRESKFLTAFVFRGPADPPDTYNILGHMGWVLRWNAKYRWVKGECVFDGMAEKKFEIDEFARGAPADASVAAKITNPNLNLNETSNALLKAAIKSIDDHPHSTFNYSVNRRRPPDLDPRSFYR